MMWRLKTCLPSVLAFCLLSPLGAQASDHEVKHNSVEHVRLVSGPHYPPFSADYLPHNGLGPFLVTQVFEASKLSVTAAFLPWKRAYRDTLLGEYDAILPCIETPERKKEFLFSLPIFDVDTYIYVQADSQISAQSLKDLKGKTYCNPLGFADGDVLDQMHSEGDITSMSASSLKNCFQMLIAGRVDFVKTDRYSADHLGRHYGFSAADVRALPFVVETASLHVMVPKAHPYGDTLIDTFNRNYRTMKHSGRITELTEEYLER